MAHCSTLLGIPPPGDERGTKSLRQGKRRKLSEEAEERILGAERRRKLEARRRWLALPRKEREVQEKWRLKGTGKFEDKFPEWETYHIPGLKNQLSSNQQLDAETYASLMRKCGRERSLKDARRVHSHIRRYFFQDLPQGEKTYMGNLVVQMYGRCRSPEDAIAAFERIQFKNMFSWSIMVECYFQNRMFSEAVELYKDMLQQGLTPNVVIISGILASCNRTGDHDMGKQVQSKAAELGFDTDPVVATALIQMHSKLGDISGAVAAFDKLKQMGRFDTIAATAMIKAYVRYDLSEKALDLYWWMRKQGLKTDGFTFSTVLGACTGPSYLLEGKHIHKHALESEDEYPAEHRITVKNALIGMYARCDKLGDAVSIFEAMDVKEAVTWNAMIAAYAFHGRSRDAFQIFDRMSELEIPYDVFSFTGILDACFGKKMLEQGRDLHSRVVIHGLGTVLVSNIISMYTSCGSLQAARKTFDEADNHDDVKTWTMMVDSYAQFGQDKQGLQLYRDMLLRGVRPDRFMFSTVADSCATLGAFEEGKKLDDCVSSSGHDRDRLVGTSLVNMFGKCGCYDSAKKAFDRIMNKDVQSWVALLSANRHGNDALQLSYLMNQEGFSQDETTAACILQSCTRGGLVDDGIGYFLSCKDDFGIRITVDVYVGLVGLFGRAGRLTEAESVCLYIPIEDAFVAWTILLGASRLHSDAKMAKVAAKKVMYLRPEYPGTYVVLGSIYAAKDRWDDVDRLNRYMRKNVVRKQIGTSSIEFNGRIHEFKDGDTLHPRNEEIRVQLEKLYRRMKQEEGYSCVEGEEQVEYHSEKLALAFGLVVNRPGRSFRIVKKTSGVCSDCHSVAKLVSKMMSREIIMRDGTHFHHFRHGLCSCGDFWW